MKYISRLMRSGVSRCQFIFFIIVLSKTVVTYSSGEIVRIGAVFPITNVLTGDVNINGSQLLAASLMALRDLNTYYGSRRNIKFKIAVRDTKRTFSNTVIASLELVSDAFTKNGSQIVVGAGYNTLTEAVAYVLKDYNIAQISYASNISSLSHDSVFPDFSRVYPSSSYEGKVICQFLSNFLHFTRVILIHSSDQYGTDGAGEFLKSAAGFNIDVVFSISIDVFRSDIKSTLRELQPYDGRVFVIIVSGVEIARQLLYQGAMSGVFYEETITVGSGSLFTKQLWSMESIETPLIDPVMIERMMGGFFAISGADDDWKVTAKGKAFIQLFRAQSDTVSIMSNGTKVCSDQTDDDGHYKLYKGSLTGQPPFYCTGNVFSSFAADGSDIASYSAYSYDATWAAGLAVMKYGDIYNNGVIPLKVNGAVLKDVLVNNVSFPGYSGNVTFSTGNNDLDSYGAGDRLGGVRFRISNFDSGNGSMSTFSLKRIGTWTNEGGFALCGADPTLQSKITGGCGEISYGTADNSKPADRAARAEAYMPQAMRTALYFFAAINFLVVAFFMYVLVHYRRTRILKASQPSMMWIILTANSFNTFRIILAGTPASTSVCVGIIWTGNLAFMSVVAMFLKTLRIFVIVKSGFKRRKISAGQVVTLMGALYLLWVVYLAFYSALAPPSVLVSYSLAITGKVTLIAHCSRGNTAFDNGLVALECLVLLASAVLCYATRDVPDAINEAQLIALALCAILAVCAIGFSISLSLQSIFLGDFLVGCCFFVASVSSMLIYFGTKTYLLLSGADLNGRFNIVRSGQSDSRLGIDPQSRTELVPKTAVECEAQIHALKGLLMGILAREAFGLNQSQAESVRCQSCQSPSLNGVGSPAKPDFPPTYGSEPDGRLELGFGQGQGQGSGIPDSDHGHLYQKSKSRLTMNKVFPSAAFESTA